MEQGVDQGAGTVSAARVHHDPDRFVEHHEVIVFVEDFDRDRFGFRHLRFRIGQVHHDAIPPPDRVFWPGWLARERHLP